jgi:STE24 endopeptidase
LGVDAWGFDEERQRLARVLQRRRRRLSLARIGVTLLFLTVLLTGGSIVMRSWALSLPLPQWLSESLFFAVLYAIGALLGLPFTYVSGYRWEREFGLSNQGLRWWAADRAKGFALGLAAVVLAGDVLLWLLAAMPDRWWIAAWVLGVLVSLALGIVGPVLLAPLFFRFRPLQDVALRTRFQELSARAQVPVIGVYEMGASAKTRRSNAAVMGFGRTRRVVITDTMLVDYSPEEIETVLAHELAHQTFLDPLKGLVVGAGVSLVMLALAALAYAATYSVLGFVSLHDMAALPLLVLYSAIVSEALGPAELAWSRLREARADRFSLDTTRNPSAFSAAMVKLQDRNLGVANPRPWEKWLFYSHMPGRERVELARSFVSSAPTAG